MGNAEMEGRLRKALRCSWNARQHGELAWCEAAPGGTVGTADVFVPLGMKRGYLPLELKFWGISSGVIDFECRASQFRFHRLAAEAKQRTAFLALLVDGSLVLLPGAHFPAPTSEILGKKAAMHYVHFLGTIELLRFTLLSENFWVGKEKRNAR